MPRKTPTSIPVAREAEAADDDVMLALVGKIDDPKIAVEVLAFMKRNGFRPKQKHTGPAREARREPAARDVRDVRRANCGKKGHKATVCQEPRR